MINAELSRVFGRIADLLEIDGADGFRVNSYRRAARTFKDTTTDIAKLTDSGTLTDLPGIGKGMARRVEQFLETGHIDVLDELQAKLPSGLPALLDISGMGPKKIALVHEQLGVTGLDDLKRVIESGEMAALPRMGVTSVKRIAEAIAFLESSGGRTPLGVAWSIAEALAERVRSMKGVKRVAIAGSIRRGRETIGDIDLLCDADDGEEVVKQFVAIEGVKRVLVAGGTKGSIAIEVERGKEVQVDLRVVETDAFGAALQYFTGSKEHNVRLREIAASRKLRLNEYGLYDGQRRIAGRSEENIYKQLGVPIVPPELREDRGEFELEGDPPDLVTLDQIRGDLHMHTTASDGKCSIEEMARSAKALGYEYIAVCDHSKSATVANGLSIERMEQHIEAIRTADKKVRGIKIFVGTECDILSDGSLDYPDDLLAKCDWVVASIHSAMGKSDSKKIGATERTLAAMEHPYVSMIGHPTGRLINRRAPMDLDIEAVVEAAARTGTFLEINASFKRLDLKDVHARAAIEGGVTLVINTDAHHFEQFAQMRYGIVTARRGGATAKDILNCLPLAELRKRMAVKRP